MPSKFKASKSIEIVETNQAEKDPILTKSQKEIEDWIDESVETLEDVKPYLKRLTKVARVAHTKLK